MSRCTPRCLAVTSRPPSNSVCVPNDLETVHTIRFTETVAPRRPDETVMDCSKQRSYQKSSPFRTGLSA
jgi:hypothetical protein